MVHQWRQMALAGLLAFLAIALTGCGDDPEVDLVRVFLEAPTEGLSDAFTDQLVLPRSGLGYTIMRDPVILERNIMAVDLVRVQGNRLALRFQLDSEGQRNLYRVSVSQRGRGLITTVNGLPLGVRLIDGPIADGVFYTFTELPPAEMEQLALQLQQNVEVIQELKKEKGML